MDGNQVVITAEDSYKGLSVGVNQAILFYHDVEADGFPALYNGEYAAQSCDFKKRMAPNVYPVSLLTNNRTVTWVPNNIIPRTWYVVVANCNPVNGSLGMRGFDEGVHIWYDIEFTNGEGKFIKHFSQDESGNFEACIVFFFILTAFMALFGLSFYRQYRQSGLETPAVRILLILLCCVGSHWIGNNMELSHLDTYSGDGVGIPSVHFAALIWEQIPEMGLIFLFLILAKGKFVSAAELQDQRSIGEIMVLYVFSWSVLTWWAYKSMDEVLDVYIYHTGAGGLMIGARVIAAFVFASMLYRTYTNEPDLQKQRFYFRFGILAFLWFLTLPAGVIISSSVYTYHRKKTVFICQNIFDMITYMWLYYGFAFAWAGVLQNDSKHAGGHNPINTDDDELSPEVAI